MKGIECPNCGKHFVKKPIKDRFGKVIVKNLFYMELRDVILLIGVFLIIFGFNQFTEQCQEAVDDPCGFCETTGCYQYTKCETNQFGLNDFLGTKNNTLPT